MKAYQFKGLLQQEKWIMPAYVHLDTQGNVAAITNKKETGISYTEVNGFALPGMQNAHSHAFQYAMVGLTEQHDLNQNRDDFWGWRKAMYQLASSVNPEQMESIATMLYMEMLRHGYTAVAEFHYIHHQISGQNYTNKAELGERLIAAAKKAGIKITLVPIYYQKGGFRQAAGADQKRFLSKNIDDYLQLLNESKAAVKTYDKATLAYGVHSMRAVDPWTIKELVTEYAEKLPFHIHVAEQKKEVTASIEYLGRRPVEWLLENVNLDENFHLVHATHLTAKETTALAKSSANVVLCPSTEGNLGDGLFPLKTFQHAGGRWSIGTDSHIGLNPFEELRILDYGQRLTSHQRNIFNGPNQGNSGVFALEKSIIHGRMAMGKRQSAFFQIGCPFDALVMDAQIPVLAVCRPENLASTIVYASDVSMHLGTMVNGDWVIKKGKHTAQQAIRKNFITCSKTVEE